MDKKIFMKNRPFDEGDILNLQNDIENALKNLSESVYVDGVVNGLNVTFSSGRTFTVNAGFAYDNLYNFIEVSSNQTVTLASGDASPRYDLIAIKFKTITTNNSDSTDKYGYGTSFIYSQNIRDSYEIVVVKGTPSSTPAVPSTPANHIALASVYVAASASTLSASNIADKRKLVDINTNFTVDATQSPSGDTGKIGQMFSWISNRIKSITGKSDWKTTPRTTLENAVKLDGDVMTGNLTVPKIILNNQATATNEGVRADRLINTGAGLLGGGNLTADRSLTLDFTTSGGNNGTDTKVARGNHNHTLDSLSNTTITSIASGEILKWNGTAWINNTLAEAGIAAASHTHLWAHITDKPLTFEPSPHDHSFASLTSKPTTLAGYGITDAALSNHNHDSIYSKLSGATFTGALNIELASGNSSLSIGSSRAESPSLYFNSSANSVNDVTLTATGGSTTANSGRLDIYATGGLYHGGNKVLTTFDMGAGKGIDADLLDGFHESAFARKSITLTGGTGITTAIGDLSTNRTISFDTSWGDARYASAGSHSFTGTITAPLLKATLEHTNGYFKIQSFNTTSYGNGYARIWWNHNLGELVIGGINNSDGTAIPSKIVVDGNRVLTVADEGSGKGIDSDTVDGLHASSFLRADTVDSQTAGVNFSGGINLAGTLQSAINSAGALYYSTADGDFRGHHGGSFGKIWGENNDGAGSGLNADMVDGIQASSFLRCEVNDSVLAKLTFTLAGESYAIDVAASSAGYSAFRRAGVRKGYIGMPSGTSDHITIYADNGDIELRPSTGVIKTKFNGGIEEDSSIFRVGQMQTSSYLALSSTSTLGLTWYEAGTSVLGWRYWGTGNGTSMQASNAALFLKNSEVLCRNTDNTAYIPLRCSSVNPSSHRDFKTNIREFEYNAIEMIKNTKIYNYQLKDEFNIIDKDGNIIGQKDSSEVDVKTGVILDEAPEIIQREDSIDLYSMVGINWQATSDVIKEVAELKDENEMLKDENEMLKATLLSIIKRVEALENK